jgi:hypothetical protein
MTLERAKEILKTYKMPMTQAQLEEFKKALSIVSGNLGRGE